MEYYSKLPEERATEELLDYLKGRAIIPLLVQVIAKTHHSTDFLRQLVRELKSTEKRKATALDFLVIADLCLMQPGFDDKARAVFTSAIAAAAELDPTVAHPILRSAELHRVDISIPDQPTPFHSSPFTE